MKMYIHARVINMDKVRIDFWIRNTYANILPMSLKKRIFAKYAHCAQS